MAITLGSNIASLRGQRQLSRTSEELGTVFQRLSSGKRINKASDDAAGLSIADSLNARSRIFNQGIRNLNDGLSLLSIADSAIENLSDIVMRLEELAEQAANGVYTNKQRKVMDDEAQALSKEFFRISKTAEFNGQRLFTGEVQSVNLQAGVGLSAVLSAGVGGAIGTGKFSSGSSFSGASTDIALGDLNGDGLLDLVTGSAGGATIRLGDGIGGFGQAITYTGSNGDVSLGDVNNDGILDLAAASTSLVVRIGRGDGTFGEATTFSLSSAANDLVLGDLNGDGNLDIVAAGMNATIRLGTGSGSFGEMIVYGTVTGFADVVTLGDLNGDGIQDLVVAGYGGPTGQAVVRLGRGDGTFGSVAEVAYLQEDEPRGIAVGDLNGDGIYDLVTTGYTVGYGGSITVHLGQGNGTFGTATTYATGGEALVVGDLNGDGILDIVTAERYSSQASVRLGTGNGTFGAATYVSGGGGTAMAIGDLNSDGVPDFVGNNGGSSNIRLANTIDGIHPLLPFSLKTLADARQALPVFKRKREQLAAQRGEIGAFQSRIDVARNVLAVSSENFKAAESRIRDADIAEESSRLVRLNILQQAAASVLAQANQQPALALQLLGR